MAKNLKLKDLTYGVCNAVEDGGYDKSFDRRRTDALTYLQTVISDYYTPDTLEKYDIFRGVVVKVIKDVPRVYLPDPQGKIDTLATESDNVVEKWWTRVKDWLSKTGNPSTSVYKVYIPELEMRPAPTSENDPIIDTYYDVLLDDNFDEDRGLFSSGPAVGQIVTVRFTDLNSFYDPRIISMGEEYNLVGFEKTSGQRAFGEGSPQRKGGDPFDAGAAKEDNRTYTIKEGLPVGTPNDRVVGEDIRGAADAQGNRTSLRRIVQNELAFWKDRVETSGDMDGDGVNETDARIQLYNDYVFVELHKYKKPQAIKDGRGYYHWSAIYISWIIGQIVAFPGYSFHTGYAAGAKSGKMPKTGAKHDWSLWMTSDKGDGNPEAEDPYGRSGQYKIQANVGDVLIQPPVGRFGRETNSHGDAVYKIAYWRKPQTNC